MQQQAVDEAQITMRALHNVALTTAWAKLDAALANCVDF
jgi:hypothetical protein